MSENILVVEYEPRYTDRVRQALAGQPFTMTFARDGEEAMKALEGDQPRLIVLSSVVPKISTTDLIRAIRGRKPLHDTPILLTVSGYNGKSPKADAQRVGASDILPKPYSETEFLGKVQQMLGVKGETASAQFTSNEIFGDLVDDKPVRKTTASRATSDVDKMLADTLAGMNVPRRKDAAPAAAQPVKPRTSPGELDKRFQDTLSGLEKTARMTSGGNVPVPPPPVAAPAPKPAPVVSAPPAAAPAPPPAAAPQPASPRFITEKMSAYVPDRVPVAQPVFTPAPEPVKVEEDEPLDGTKFGQYVLVEKIATGGMAEVWKARMRGVEGFQKIVAIKKILPHLSDNQDFIEMFVDEAKLAAQLNHNNIIHIYDLGKIQASYYIAMEYIDGFDLKTILRQGQERDNPLNVELALFIASKIASALDYAHRKRDFEDKEMGLVHRDVSPQNVLISQEGDIKLCDFGIAKAASKASHTQAGALKGKLQYMAPEQAWGRNIDRRSDVFALATVLFEMLTGRKLFTGDNEISILEQVREAQVQPPSLYNDEVTPEIDKIVLKALQKDPANRYQTAGEMARELDAVLYSFRPTPTSADLAIYMHRLSTDEPQAAEPEPFADEPTVSPSPGFAPVVVPAAAFGAPAAAAAVMPPVIAGAPAADVTVPYGDVPEQGGGKSKAGLIAAGLLVAALGAAAFVMTRKPSANAAQPAPATSTVAAATSTVAPSQLTTSAAGVPADTVPLTATTGSIDPSLVDAEVQKRIAAERARLEALARAQQQQPGAPAAAVPAAVPAPRPAVPTPTPQQVAQQTPAPAVPQPQQQQPAAPTPAPVTQEPARQPEVAETRPTPAPQQPAAAQQTARAGDLVAPGTDGLSNPRLLRRGQVPYPAMARAQKVEGTVITNVLVSETGSVLEVRIVRGISRAPALNEAAAAAMRRSSFAPGTKDGVKVKAWITVPVEFKL
jgi:TonB family protein